MHLLVILEYDTVFCMQFLSLINSFKHISRSISGTFAAIQPPYSLAWKNEFLFSKNNQGRYHKHLQRKVIKLHVQEQRISIFLIFQIYIFNISKNNFPLSLSFSQYFSKITFLNITYQVQQQTWDAQFAKMRRSTEEVFFSFMSTNLKRKKKKI